MVPAEANLTTPDKFINAKVEYYLDGFDSDDEILATVICEYAVSYVFESNVQYEISLQKDSLLGNIRPTPKTVLTKEMSSTDSTITVETTIGFPYTGVIYIENEGISYTSKSLNQFFGCTRGHIGVATKHKFFESVFGQRKLRATTTIDDVKYETYCFVLGLADSIKVVDGGLMHKINDPVHVNGPGAVDPRQPILTSFIENITEVTVTESIGLPDVTNITAGVNSVYFNSEFCLAGTSGFPYYTIGQFSSDNSVGPNLTSNPITYAIPSQNNLKGIDTIVKGTNQIGVFVDGVPAYSDDSPRRVVQGDIADFTVLVEGRGYVNPTVILNPSRSTAQPVVVDGRVVRIDITGTASPSNYYESDPEVRITSGEGATFELAFDLYGRITAVTVVNGGNYYKDVPVLSVVDSSNRGRGALLAATISGGSITSVTVVDSGIDYNPATTAVVDFPIGSGAVATATVQYYQYNRYQEVVNNATWTFDSGNGFLYQGPDESIERSNYGYVCSPTQLRNKLGDIGLEHSPILGWALDGNPIYGPYGYTNGKTSAGGVSRMESGYQLQANRDNIIPGGEIVSTGLVPPPVDSTYPMGTFVQDFIWTNTITDGDGFRLTTETGREFNTQGNHELLVGRKTSSVPDLDRNNGRTCNTPEYPEELYPDGVYAYFITIDANGNPAFPYILGENYNNAPVEWYLSWNKEGVLPRKIRFGANPYTPVRSLDTRL